MGWGSGWNEYGGIGMENDGVEWCGEGGGGIEWDGVENDGIENNKIENDGIKNNSIGDDGTERTNIEQIFLNSPSLNESISCTCSSPLF